MDIALQESIKDLQNRKAVESIMTRLRASVYRRALVVFGIIGVALSLILGLLTIIPLQMVAVLIAVSLGIPSLILTYEKLKPEASIKPSTEKKEQEQKKPSLASVLVDSVKEEKEIPARKETIVVSPTEGYYYEFTLLKGNRVKGEISSTSRLDIYFLDEVNFDKWDRDVTFYHENCNESILKADIDYEAPRRGTWFVAIGNRGRKTATVKVNLFIIDGSSFGTE